MFKWFKNKNEKEEVKEIEVVVSKNNYKTKENGDIEIRVEQHTLSFRYIDNIVIPKPSIISYTKNSIVFKSYQYRSNFEPEYYVDFEDYFINYDYRAIVHKSNFIKYRDTLINVYEYFEEDECWKQIKTEVVGTEVTSEKTPIEIFKETFKSQYSLIETEDEFNDYMKSTLDCDTWCKKKLYNKMKELGLGDGFINQFADLIGNNLDKYHTMIDLANEVTDKDTLMYLYTYKFGKN